MNYCPVCDRKYENDVDVCELDGNVLRKLASNQDYWLGKTVKGRYRVMQQVGEGGMGSVYLAEHLSIGRKIALKILHEKYVWDEEFVARFRREARLTASLNHPNVITVYDFDQLENGGLFIAMEYLEGKNLKRVIQDGSLDIFTAVQLAVQIAAGLGAAHHIGVIHRDIKPENIMIAKEMNQVKLADFGIARLRDPQASTAVTRAGTLMGTAEYMAPEQIEGGEVSEKTDIYAFGIVLYEMLSGQVPFKGETRTAVLMKHLKEIPDPLRKLRVEVPHSVEHLITQALQKKPEDRPGSMEEITEVLRGAVSNPAPVAPPKGSSFTQRIEKTKEAITYRKSRVMDFVGKAQTMTLSRLKHLRRTANAQQIQPEEEVLAQLPNAAKEDQTGLENSAMQETMVVRRTLQAVREKVNWAWVALGAAIIAACLVGLVMYVERSLEAGNTLPPIPTKEESVETGFPRLPDVLTPPLWSIKVQADRAELRVGEQIRLRATGIYTDGQQNELNLVQWESRNTNIARVDPNGEVEALKPGRVQITAWYQGQRSDPLNLLVKAILPKTDGKIAQPPTRPKPPLEDFITAARAERVKGNYDEALELLKKAHQNYPNNEQIQEGINEARTGCEYEKKNLNRLELHC